MFDAEFQEQQVEPVDYIRPYRPKLMDASALQLNRLLAGGRIRHSHFGDSAVKICALPLLAAPLVSPRALRVMFGQCELYVQLGADALELAAGELQIPDSLDHLTGVLRDAVLVAFIESFVGQVFGVVPLSIHAVQSDSLDQNLLGITVEMSLADQAPLNTRVLVHPDFASVVVEWLSQQEAQMREPVPALAKLPLLTECLLDEFFVAQSVIQSLQLGDVIITDAQEHEVLVRISGQLQQKGRLMDENLTLDGYLEEFEQEMTAVSNLKRDKGYDAGVNLAEASAYQTPGFQEAQDLFQEIPMQMTFGLHQTQLPLDVLRQLNAGQCIPLPANSPSEITIAVNGKSFARGQLVRIDDQIGVKIIQFVE